MQITIGGYPGSGKSTAGKLLAEKLGYKFYSIGTIRRQLAKERGLAIHEFNNLKENTDAMVDDSQKKLAKENNIVVEGRLAFYFLPKSIKFFFIVDLNVAAKRIFNDKRESEHPYKTIQECLKAIQERMENDKERYDRYYKIDAYDKKHFDHILDTTSHTIEQTAQEMLRLLKK